MKERMNEGKKESEKERITILDSTIDVDFNTNFWQNGRVPLSP